MGNFLTRVRDLFCYCGLSKEEYRLIKKDAYISNYTVWKYLSIFLYFDYAFMALVSIIYNGFSASAWIQLGITLFFVVYSLLFFLVFKKDSIVTQFAIYFAMIVLLVSALLINIYQPEATMSATFLVLLILLPIFMIDKPYFMSIVLSAAVVIYLVVIKNFKTPDVFRYEIVYSVSYGALGIAINTFYNFIRIREFELRKHESEHVKEEQRANEETVKLNKVLKTMSEGALELLGDIVEERDAESGEHIRRVKGFTYLLAKQVMNDLPEYHLDNYTVDLIAFTSALHDVGKISITDSILCKPGKLSKEEFEIMKTHCEKGCVILNKMKDKWSKEYLDMGMSICMNHHEKWDGKGYPNGLKGDEIPIEAQIVSIADIFDALTTKRVYKDAYSYEDAYNMIINGECGAFSEKMLGCFTKCYPEFVKHATNLGEMQFGDRDYELVSVNKPEESFVIGLHDNDRVLREKIRLNEELSVLESLTETFMYVCYVDIAENTVKRVKADEQIEKIISGFDPELPTNLKFDKLMNTIVHPDDYKYFREATDRDKSMELLKTEGHFTVRFRVIIFGEEHYCRMRITLDKNKPSAVIIGISQRDDKHRLEAENLSLQKELEKKKNEEE